MNCPFCAAEDETKGNYCSSCGSPQYLRLCPHCEGVNDKTATACISCGGALAAGLQTPKQSEESMAAAPEPMLHRPLLAADGGVVETQQFSWRGPILLLLSAAIGIASYFSLPPEPLSMLVVGSARAADKRIGDGIAAAPPAASASPRVGLDNAIAAIPAVVPEARANSAVRADGGPVDPLGELIAAKPPDETAPEASTAPRPNHLKALSVPDAGNARAHPARPGTITSVSDIPVRARSGHAKSIHASSKTIHRDAMLGASNQAVLEPVKRHLY